MKIREHFTWSTVPIIVNLITFAFYVSAFHFLGDSSVSLQIVMGTDLILYALLALFSLWVLCSAQEVEKNFRKSSCLILVIALVRLTEASLAVFHPQLLARTIIGQSAFPIIFWVIYFAANEYFSSHIARGNRSASVTAQQATQINEEERLVNKPNPNQSTRAYTHDFSSGDNKATQTRVMKPETINLVLMSVMGIAGGLTALDNSSLYLYLLNQMATLILLICGCVWVLFEIQQLRPLSHRGVFFSNVHSDGLAWLLLLFGAAGRSAIDIYFYAIGDQVATSTNFITSKFIALGKEIFTTIIPYTFHLFNIQQRKRYSFLPSQGQMCDSAGRIKFVFYVSFISLHLVLVGFVLEVGATRHPLINASLCAALLASADLCFVVLAFMAPIGSFLSKHFALGVVQSNEKNHLHRNMAYSAILFALIHIGIHFKLWGSLFPVFATIGPLPTYGIPVNMYTIRSIPIVTGMIMVACLLGSLITGYLLPHKKNYTIASLLHIPLSCIGLAAFFAHGFGGIFTESIGSEICLAFSISSAVISTIYFIFTGIQTLEVDHHKSQFGAQYILLSVKYGGSKNVPPGAYFNVFACGSSHLSIFHCHSFSAFAVRNSRLLFLIRRRKVEGNRVSFTSRLAIEQPTSIRTQGPFKGPASSFVLSLNSTHLSKLNKCIVLCGWESGIASIFSLLEYFKNNSYSNIHSILCVFSEIEDTGVREELHSCVAATAREWPWKSIQLCVTEVKSLSTIYEFTDACSATVSPRGEWQRGVTNSEIWFSENENIEESGTIQARLLYYCGSDSLDASRLSRWKLYIESP